MLKTSTTFVVQFVRRSHKVRRRGNGQLLLEPGYLTKQEPTTLREFAPSRGAPLQEMRNSVRNVFVTRRTNHTKPQQEPANNRKRASSSRDVVIQAPIRITKHGRQHIQRSLDRIRDNKCERTPSRKAPGRNTSVRSTSKQRATVR